MPPFSLISILLILLLKEVKCQIIASSDLNCDFSTDCRWRNSTDESGKWAISNKIQIDQGHSIMPMSNPDSLFAYTQGFMGRTTAVLVSDVVSCQLGGANLKYWYYKTGAISQLEICVKQPPGSKENANLRCYDGMSSTLAQQWIFRVIELPPSSQPFEILFRATFFPPSDVIAVDDIVFNAALCEIANDGANQGAGGGFADETSPVMHSVHRHDETPVQIAQLTVDTPQKPLSFAAPTAVEVTRATARVGSQFTPMCPLIDCTFDDGKLCNYLTSNSTSPRANLREWRASSRGILNTLTGIPHDLSKEGFFLFAGGERVKPSDTFILSTKTPFSLKDAVTLDFFVYQAGFKGRLSVCSNTINDCSLVLDGSNITNTARQWKNYQISLSPSTHAVHFVADRLHDNYAIGLDHIQLLNKYGSSSLAC